MSHSSDEFDAAFVARLRRGDERAFRDLVAALHGALLRLARGWSRDDTVVEEAVQETWVGVFRGIGAFEGRAPLRSWVFGILVNQAKKHALRARRRAQVESGGAFGAAGRPEDEDPLEGSFQPDGHWREFPEPWDLRDPVAAFETAEARAVIERTIEALPDSQRQVLLLRDVEGLDSQEVCNILGLAGTHERVLLHRGRVRVRQALDAYVKGADSAPPAPRRERRSES